MIGGMVSLLTLGPAVVFLLAGFVVVRAGGRLDQRRSRFGRSAVRTRAQVVDGVEAVVRFTGSDGTTVETRLLGDTVDTGDTGDTVDIEYDEDDPSRAALRHGRGSGRAIGPVMIASGSFVMFLGLLLAGLWVLLKPVFGVSG
jgi:hypothetical protein